MKQWIIFIFVLLWFGILAQEECVRPDDWDDEVDGSWEEFKHGFCNPIELGDQMIDGMPIEDTKKPSHTIVIGMDGWKLTFPDDLLTLQAELKQLREDVAELGDTVKKHEQLLHVQDELQMLNKHMVALKSLIQEQETKIHLKEFLGV